MYEALHWTPETIAWRSPSAIGCKFDANISSLPEGALLTQGCDGHKRLRYQMKQAQCVRGTHHSAHRAPRRGFACSGPWVAWQGAVTHHRRRAPPLHCPRQRCCHRCLSCCWVASLPARPQNAEGMSGLRSADWKREYRRLKGMLKLLARMFAPTGCCAWGCSSAPVEGLG